MQPYYQDDRGGHEEVGKPGEIPISDKKRQEILDNLLANPETRANFEAANERAALRARSRQAKTQA